MADREAAFADFKEILNIQPEHREALYQLARGASEDRDAESAAHWLVQFLAAAADDARAPEARLDLAACYESLKDRARAVETLRRAAACGPAVPKPLQRLSDLLPAPGEWRRRSRRCRRRSRACPTSASARRCTSASDRSCAIWGATRRARRPLPACRGAGSAGRGDARAGRPPRCRR